MDTLKLSAACGPSSLSSTNFGKVAALVAAYTEYLNALTSLCGRGVQLIQNFVGSSSVDYMLPSKEKEEVQKLSGIWDNINKSMLQSIYSVRTQSLQSLQDWLQQKFKESSLQECPSQSDDLSKLITACLVAFTQLQFQFSSLCCHPFTELDLVRSEHNSGEYGTNSLSLICENELDKERRDSGNVSDDLTMSSIADPLLSQLQLGRRSSYELGNLHTASPPPPSADSLGRRWSMPTEDLVLDENKISPHFTGSSLEKKREILVSHEELNNVINLLSFSHGGAATTSTSGSNLGINKLSSAANNNKLDNLSLPQPSRSHNSKFGHRDYVRHQQQHEQSLLEFRSRSSKNVSSNAGSGLLSVASMISPDCKELQASRKILMHGLGGQERELGVNKEGAFSIGLNLVGSDLMASVQQKQNEEKSTLPHIIIPEENDKIAHTQSSLGDTRWLSGETVEHPPPDFLHFSLNTSPGNSIWTPSQNDYSSPKGNYYF